MDTARRPFGNLQELRMNSVQIDAVLVRFDLDWRQIANALIDHR